MAEGFRQRLREGGINPQDLVITRVLSQPVADYKVDTPTALAARQLEAAGIHIQPGEKVRYVHREGKRGPKECRVPRRRFWRPWTAMTPRYYLELLERAMDGSDAPREGGNVGRALPALSDKPGTDYRAFSLPCHFSKAADYSIQELVTSEPLLRAPGRSRFRRDQAAAGLTVIINRWWRKYLKLPGPKTS